MSDTNDDGSQANEEGGLAGLREAARKGKAAVDENVDLRRQLLFARAGIDTTSKLGGMLFATFQGDDIEALKGEATEIGLLKVEQAPRSAEELEADANRQTEDDRRRNAQDATSGNRAAGDNQLGEGEHPINLALEGFQQAVREGADREEAQTDAMARVISAAAKGDKRVFFDQAKHQAAGEAADRAAVTGRRSN